MSDTDTDTDTGMRATFLGTGDASGYPNAFCTCDNCTRARHLGGPSLRLRSSLLINDDLLIDLGPDVPAASQRHGVSLERVRYCLQTHEHEDHLAPANFLIRGMSLTPALPRLHFYGTQGAVTEIQRDLPKYYDDAGTLTPEAEARLNFTTHVIAPFETFAVGPYRVQSVRATHDPSIVPMLYAIERGGRSLFYGTDTSDIAEATWDALTAAGHRFNAVVLDHTFGVGARNTGHMNAEQFRAQVTRIRDLGLLADDARVFATHIAHHSNPPHPDLVAIAAAHGYDVACDGLTVAV